MAATSCHRPHHLNHRLLKIRDQDDNNFIRLKSSQTVAAKRKSAVELLQETKSLYVKSETVLDRKQELRRSLRTASYQLPNNDTTEEEQKEDDDSSSPPLNSCVNAATNTLSATGKTKDGVSRSPASGLPVLLPSLPNASPITDFPITDDNSSYMMFPLAIPPPPEFRKSVSSIQLQNKLRKLLGNVAASHPSESSKVAAANVHNWLKVKRPSRRKDTFGYSGSEYSSEKRTNHVNFNSYKSLPDLTNVSNLSLARSEKSADHHIYANASDSVSSDGIYKRSVHTDCLSLVSCKNGCLYASIDYCKSEIDVNFEGEIENDDAEEFSLPVSPVKSCTSFITPPSLYCDNNELKKSYLRTTATSRNASEFTGFKLVTDIPLYDLSNLNMFFDNLGLASQEQYTSLTAVRSNSSSPVYFESSDSSVSSTSEYASGGENCNSSHVAELPSVVERNARIIKWLCNCRKALEQMPRFCVGPQSR